MASDPITADERRLLELLAASEDGCTDALLAAHGFAREVIFSVARAGHATVHPGRLLGRGVEVSRVRITDAGRLALAEE